MQNNSKQQQALAAAKTLFRELDATEVLEELDLIFMGYLDSQFANCQNARSFRVGTYFSLKSYFKEMQSLQITKPRTYVEF